MKTRRVRKFFKARKKMSVCGVVAALLGIAFSSSLNAKSSESDFWGLSRRTLWTCSDKSIPYKATWLSEIGRSVLFLEYVVKLPKNLSPLEKLTFRITHPDYVL